MIAAIDAPTIEELLLNAAMTHRDVLGRLKAEFEAKQREEAQRVIDFDHLSKIAWRELHVRHVKKNPATQRETALDVARHMQHIFQDMADEAPARASYGTKRNAIETMRKICKSILLMPHCTLQRHVGRNIGQLDGLMLQVLKGFTDVELARLVNEAFGGEWLNKLDELVELSEGYNVLGGLPGILAFCERAATPSKQ